MLVNVNIPKFSDIPIRGIKVCHQAKGKWIEEFDERFSPMGKRYFWLTGKFIKDDESQDADQNILNENYISVVPVNFDLTSYSHVNHIDKLLND